MFARYSRFVFLLALWSGFAYSQWIDLGVKVIASDVSRSQNRLVLVSANPNQLHLYDPQTNTKSSVALAAEPLSVSVAADGHYAAVGHLNSISYVRLNPLAVERTYTISGPANSVVIIPNGYIYGFPSAYVSISSGAQSALPVVNHLDWRYTARLHPNGNSIIAAYWATALRFDISSGAPVMTPVAPGTQYGWCGGFWYLSNGSRMLDACGAVWQVPAAPGATNFSLITTAAPSGGVPAEAVNNLLLIGAAKSITLADANTYAPIATFHLPRISPFDNSSPELSTLQLLDNDSRAVVLNNPPSWQSTHALILDLPGSQRCSPVIGGSSTLPSEGGFTEVQVTVAPTCLWYPQNLGASWTSITGPNTFLGSGVVKLFAPPAGMATVGTFPITILGQTVNLTQALSTVPSTSVAFPYALVDSAYDKVNDRWLLLTRNPNRLWAWSTIGRGIVGLVDLPEQPLSLGITKEGTFAAIAQRNEGSFTTRFTHVDLLTMQPIGTHTVSSLEPQALFVGGGYIHALGQNSSRSYNVATQQWSSNVSGVTYSGTVLHPSGTAIYGPGATFGFRRFPIDQPLSPRPDFATSSSACGFTTFSESGEDFLTRCARVGRLLGPTSAVLWGRLPALESSLVGTHSKALRAWIVNLAPTRVGLYSEDTLARTSVLTFPSVLREPGASKLAASPDGQRVYAVTRDTNDLTFEIRALSPAGTNGCTATLQATPSSVSASGGSIGVNIAVPSGCWWQLTDAPAWAVPLIAPYNNGSVSAKESGALAFSIAPNTTASSRTGVITIGGAGVTVTQAAGSVPVGAPYAQSVSPSSGIVSAATFVARFSDPAGVGNIALAYLSIGHAPSQSSTCTIEYARASNSFRLLGDDGGNNFIPLNKSAALWAGSNSQCGILAKGLGAVAMGDTLVITVPVVFSYAFDGTRHIYLLASSTSNVTSYWRRRGTIEVADGEPNGVGVQALLPVSGSGQVNGFKALFTHGGGATEHYLAYMLFLKTPNIVWYTAKDSCLVEYNRISNGMRLVNDKGDDWIGPPEGTPLGSATTLRNGVCSVNLATARASADATVMTVEVEVTFLSGTPVMATFLQAFDVKGRYTGMTQMGTWGPSVGAAMPGPAITGVAQSAQLGTNAVVAVTATHGAGLSNLSMVHLRVSPEIVTGNACHVIYFVAENSLNLVTDDGMALVSAANVPLGAPGTLSNSRCSLSTASASRSTTATGVTLHVPLTFNVHAFDGYHRVYANAFDNTGNLTHWVTGGIFRVE